LPAAECGTKLAVVRSHLHEEQSPVQRLVVKGEWVIRDIDGGAWPGAPMPRSSRGHFPIEAEPASM